MAQQSNEEVFFNADIAGKVAVKTDDSLNEVESDYSRGLREGYARGLRDGAIAATEEVLKAISDHE